MTYNDLKIGALIWAKANESYAILTDLRFDVHECLVTVHWLAPRADVSIHPIKSNSTFNNWKLINEGIADDS